MSRFKQEPSKHIKEELRAATERAYQQALSGPSFGASCAADMIEPKPVPLVTVGP